MHHCFGFLAASSSKTSEAGHLVNGVGEASLGDRRTSEESGAGEWDQEQLLDEVFEGRGSGMVVGSGTF